MTTVFSFFFDIFRNVFQIFSFSRKSLKNSMSVFVKCDSGRTLAVDLDPKWDIKDVKNMIAPEMNANPSEVKIIFAGKELEDSTVLQDCDLGNQSVLHAVKLKSASMKSRKFKSTTLLRDTIIDDEDISTNNEDRRIKSQFYVYCSACQGMKVGKLRVRCFSCKSGAFTVDTDPKSWDDVLKSHKISGNCEETGCKDGVFGWADFYFKCAEHTSGGNDNYAVPLNLIKNNHRKVPCLACTEIKDIVFVFPCKEAHVTCIDCFHTYAVLRLRERQFTLDKIAGYSISCPVGCTDSLITECHHFKILTKEEYELYQRFSTEECVLQAGGILCPQPGCGEGILIDQSSCDKVVCVNGCGFVFCSKCLRGYHIGDCEVMDNTVVVDDIHQVIDPEKASQARWDEASSVAIRITTKPCPQCRTATERSGGCMHMICTRCNFHWCWVCQTEWNRECMGTHWFS